MTHRLPRKLAVIFYADVAEYSRLTGEDEDATHHRLSEYLDVIADTIDSHGGIVMHYAGDAVLAKFDAVVDALGGALAIQQELATRNQDLPEQRKVQFRIGINLGDGITEDIITALSRMPWFFVIARNSSFTYKAKSVGVQHVARELGVQYVLEGSVRKAGQRVRISAQFIDALTGNHVWAERYDRELADVFAVQDEVVNSIVGAVAPEFLSAEARRARHANPAELNAWDCVMRGRSHMWRLAWDELAQARVLFERAVQLVPGGEFGASDLALTHLFESYYNWTDSRSGSMQEMLRCAKQAVAANDHDAWAHTTLGLAKLWALEWDEALPPLEHAIALYPNFAPALGAKCLVLACVDEVERAIECYEQAIRLSPHDSLIPLWLVGRTWAYWASERYAEALASAREFIRLAPDNPTARRQLAACYAATGQVEKARLALTDYLRIEPNHTAQDIMGRLPSRNAAHVERFVDALRAAGLPD